ncbi:MAG: dephospho-CoA kinase [Bacteroidetes bacterium]|nr:dephospho-CoA kinase [Bacteroidota bacterium]
MLRVGITGGIGSGKSTVCGIFARLGIPVYAADREAKRLMREDLALIASVKEAFGSDSYSGNEPNRPFLANAVFGNPEKLALLNSLVHPAVFRDFERWCGLQHAPYVIKEAAIMFESGSYKQVHEVVAVTAPLELRIQRVMERDGSSREEILKRIQAQMPQEEVVKRAHDVINNDGTHSLIRQVVGLHRQFLARAKEQA